jgi:hypothetical protein
MPQQFKNNARALLASGITAADTALTVEAPKADLFPTANVGAGAVPSANDWFKVTLENASGQCEIIYVRTRTAGSAVFSNVMRGQEGTTARAYAAGDVVGLRMTAVDVTNAIAILGNVNLFTAQNTFQQQLLLTAGAKIGTYWTVVETGGVLYFAHGGTNKMKLDSSGNLTIAGDLTIDGVV